MRRQPSYGRHLVKVLRHTALERGIEIGDDGFVQLESLLQLNELRGCTIEHVEDIVRNCNKQRLMLITRESTTYIRANQGHTINCINSSKLLTKVKDFKIIPVCVHGTNLEAWKVISKSGLSKMKRQHIHMAPGLPGDNGVVSGPGWRALKSDSVIVYVNTKKAMEAGIPFYISANKVILSPGNEKGFIESRYFENVCDVHGNDLLS